MALSNPRKTAFAATAKTIIKNLQRNNMEGYFCETSRRANLWQAWFRKVRASHGAEPRRSRKLA